MPVRSCSPRGFNSGVTSSMMPFLTPPFYSSLEQLILMSALCLINVLCSRSPVRPGPSLTQQRSVPASLAMTGVCGLARDIDGMHADLLPRKCQHTNMDGFLAPFFLPAPVLKNGLLTFKQVFIYISLTY